MKNTILMWAIGIPWYAILGLSAFIVLYEIGAMLFPNKIKSRMSGA